MVESWSWQHHAVLACRRLASTSVDTTMKMSLWRRFAAAIDQLEYALSACPEQLWQGSLWKVRPEDTAVEPAGAEKV